MRVLLGRVLRQLIPIRLSMLYGLIILSRVNNISEQYQKVNRGIHSIRILIKHRKIFPYKDNRPSFLSHRTPNNTNQSKKIIGIRYNNNKSAL